MIIWEWGMELGKWRVTTNGHEVLGEDHENVLKQTVVMTTPLQEYAKNQ